MAVVTPHSPAPAARSANSPSANEPRGLHHWLQLTRWDRAYAREMLLPMSIGLIVLILVLAGNFVYWAINSVVNQGMNVSPVVRLFLLAAPGFAVQGIPVGVILAVCLVLNRAVRDNEIVALRVGGASIPRILAPFLMMALLASLADWLIVEKVAPVTNDLAEKTLLKLMSRAATPLIESDKYFRAGNFYFYVGRKDGDVLKDVMVYQREINTADGESRFPSVQIARLAYENPKVANQWILEDGVMHKYNAKGEQVFEGHFDRTRINVAQQLSTYWDSEKQPFSMTSSELDQRIRDLSNAAFNQNKLLEWRVDYYRRFALPFACFVMALLAAPLALRFARQGSFAGLVLAFSLGFFWQGFDGWFRALGIAGTLSPITAAWGTNALFLGAGIAFLWRDR